MLLRTLPTRHVCDSVLVEWRPHPPACQSLSLRCTPKLPCFSCHHWRLRCLPSSSTYSPESSLTYLFSSRSPRLFLGHFSLWQSKTMIKEAGRLPRGRGSNLKRAPCFPAGGPGTNEKAHPPQEFIPDAHTLLSPQIDMCQSVVQWALQRKDPNSLKYSEYSRDSIVGGGWVCTVELECRGSNPSPITKPCSHGWVTKTLSSSVFSFLKWE